MFRVLLSVFFLNALFVLGGCNEEKKTKKVTDPQITEIIIQNPGLKDIMKGPNVAIFRHAHIEEFSNENSVIIEKKNKDKIGWALWIFNNIPANKNYIIKMKIKKGDNKKILSQLQIKFITHKKTSNQYFYVFRTGTGLVIPQQKAKKNMVSVVDKGRYWLFSLQAKSPTVKSAMHFMLLPVVGGKTSGVLEVKSIEVM